MLIYDITDEETFNNLEKWKEEFLEYSKIENEHEFPFAVVGNKCDKED